jgi:uncharacterized coiled-coil protein SlyX
MPTVYIPDVAITLRSTTCYLCGIPFAMPADLMARRLEDHRNFWCPNGHDQHYLAETEAQRLAKELRAKNDELARKQSALDQSRARSADLETRVAHQDRRINGYKGVVARTKRRVSKGRCPCCSHTFKDLKSHMATKHPKWDPDHAAEVAAEKAP